jgi:hypothetical protein
MRLLLEGPVGHEEQNAEVGFLTPRSHPARLDR